MAEAKSKKIVLVRNTVVDKKDKSRGDVVALLANEANLLISMNRAHEVDTVAGKALLKAVSDEKAAAKAAEK